MYNTLDTIAAIATAPGESALAIVRISGPKAREIVESVFFGARLENKKASYGRICAAIGQQIDEVVVIFYQKPHGFTAEDMIEIICHGGRVVPNQILQLLCHKGARLAEPGEFTLRAFLNGRIDLTAAEAIDSVVRARSTKAIGLALGNLEGKLHERLIDAQNRMANIISLIEAEIDFGDDEVVKTPLLSLTKQIQDVHGILHEIVGTYDVGRLAEGRVEIAIVGAPNVGKSTLFNAILKDNRAIVADTPGTTRDFLSEYVDIAGYPVILTDTAGVRNTENKVESLGIERTVDIIRRSSLCLLVLDITRDLNDDDRLLYKMVRNLKYILVVNKIDMGQGKLFFKQDKISGKAIEISAQNGVGIDTLMGEINLRLVSGLKSTDFGVLFSQRQYSCAMKALDAIDGSLQAINRHESEEVVVSFLHESIDYLSEILGKITRDDILNQIFSRFCIGK